MTNIPRAEIEALKEWCESNERETFRHRYKDDGVAYTPYRVVAAKLAALLRALPQTVKASDTTASSEEKQEPRWPSDYGGHRFVGEVCDRCGIPEIGASGYVVNGRCPGNPLMPLRYRCERCGRAFRSGEKMCSSSQCLAPAQSDATPAPSGEAQKDLRQRSIELLRDTLSMLCNFIWTRQMRPGEHMWSIPVDRERDFYCIFSDAIDELEWRRTLASAHAISTPAVIAEIVQELRDWAAVEDDSHALSVILNQWADRLAVLLPPGGAKGGDSA